jgi:hypothetical protein
MIIMVGDVGIATALMIRIGIKIIFIITGMPVIATAISLCGLGVVWTLRKKSTDSAGNAHDKLGFIIADVLSLTQMPRAVRSKPPQLLNGYIQEFGQAQLGDQRTQGRIRIACDIARMTMPS